MYHHVKKLLHAVRVDAPDPKFGNMLLEQIGGANGELVTAMQYFFQALNCDDLALKDLLMDVATEELSHLEIVAALARLHLQPMKFDRDSADVNPLLAVADGAGVNLFNSQGSPWTADYLKISGEVDIDLRSNIATEARSKILYERLINFTVDAGTKDTLQFLMTREVAHLKAFTAALESLGKPPFMVGRLPATAGLVDQFLNTSTGDGDAAEVDARGPWNEKEGVELVQAPALQAIARDLIASDGDLRVDNRATSSTDAPELIEELLVDRVQQLIYCESQLVRALPRMRHAARALPLKLGLENHFEETKVQVQRLLEATALLGVKAQGVVSRGMRGLIDEAMEIIDAARQQDDVAADLALIGIVQKIEHYEIAAYDTARTMASQLGLPTIAQLFNKSLAEEQIADCLMGQLARELLSRPRTIVRKLPNQSDTRNIH